MCNCVQKFLESQTWRCTICIRHYPIQTTSLPMKNHWPKQKKFWLFWGRTIFLVWNVPSANGGLMCMSTKGNAQVPIQVVLMIPMPSCCWTGKIHWIISSPWCMKLVTVCILAIPVKPNLMSMGTTQFSLLKSPLQPMKISWPNVC